MTAGVQLGYYHCKDKPEVINNIMNPVFFLSLIGVLPSFHIISWHKEMCFHTGPTTTPLIILYELAIMLTLTIQACCHGDILTA